MTLLPSLAGKKMLSLGFLLLMGFTALPSEHKAEAPITQAVMQAAELEGAWRLSSSTGQKKKATQGATAIKIMEDGYFSVAFYDKAGKEFLGTYGGTYSVKDGKLTERYEFNTFDSTVVGTAATGTYTLRDGNMQVKGLKNAGAPNTWEKVQEGTTGSPLAGAWRISARLDRDGQMSPMRPGPRKTIKMLSGNRFQWIAFNSETAGFFGTGGGTYTVENGKYTENIEFFSRDSSRVGQQLTFDYDIKNGDWHHSGLSSTGNRVSEVWQRQRNQR